MTHPIDERRRRLGLTTRLDAKVRASVLIPGRISGGIAKSERPPQYREPGDEEQLRLERQRYEARMRSRRGEPAEEYRSPDEIAAQVCDAIRAERFYILTHAKRTKEQVSERADAILGDGLPVVFHG